MSAPKYVQPAEVGNAAAYKPSAYPSGVLITTPQPAYSLSGITGLLDTQTGSKMVNVAPTPPNLRASLQDG